MVCLRGKDVTMEREGRDEEEGKVLCQLDDVLALDFDLRSAEDDDEEDDEAVEGGAMEEVEDEEEEEEEVEDEDGIEDVDAETVRGGGEMKLVLCDLHRGSFFFDFTQIIVLTIAVCPPCTRKWWMEVY